LDAEKRIWLQLRETAPFILVTSDEVFVGIAVNLLAKLKAGTITAGEINSLNATLKLLGFNDVKRVKRGDAAKEKNIFELLKEEE